MKTEEQVSQRLQPLSQIKLSQEDKMDILNNLRREMASDALSVDRRLPKKRNRWLARTILTAGTVAAAAVLASVMVSNYQSKVPAVPGLRGVISNAYAYTLVAPSHFNAIDMTSPVYGWGTGYDKAGHFELIKTMDGGKAWNKVELPVKPPLYDVSTNQIGQPGYVVADFLSGSIGYLSWIDDAKRQMTVMHTTDGGEHWLVSHTKVSTYANAVANVDFLNANQGWILATSTPGMGSEQKYLYKTSDGGANWVSVADSGALPSQGTTTSLHFTDDRHGWFGTGDMDSNTVNLYQTSDGGKQWNSIHVPIPTSFTVQSNAIATTTPAFHGKDGAFVASYMRLENGSDDNYAVVYHTTDGGATWAASVSPLLKDVPNTALYMSVQNGWAVIKGTVYHTTDSGQAWKPVGSLPGNTRKSYPLLSQLTFINHTTGWMLLQSADFQHSRLLKTTDGGRTWHMQP